MDSSSSFTSAASAAAGRPAMRTVAAGSWRGTGREDSQKVAPKDGGDSIQEDSGMKSVIGYIYAGVANIL